MHYPNIKGSIQQNTRSFSVFGQTWQFSAPAVSTLNLYGLGTVRGLKALIINNGTYSGIAEGTHEINYMGVSLQLIVRGNLVLVVDPYIQ